MLLLSALLAALSYVQYSNAQAQALPEGVSPGGDSSSLSITLSNGDTRQYLLHIPRNLSDPSGLLFVYSGRGSSNGLTESFTRFSSEKRNGEMIVVYPEGTLDDSNEDVFEGDPGSGARNLDDIGFTLELLDQLQATYSIDENRIYAAGMSNGGGFVANHLACDEDAASRFAAFGAVSAAYYQMRDANRRSCNGETVKITCSPKTHVALLDIHGGRDSTIPYEGGYRRRACLPSLPHFMTSWAERNGMGSANQSTKVYKGGATHYSYGEGEAAGMIQHYYVPTLGHAWASGSNGEVLRATDILIQFFGNWTLEARKTAAQNLPESSANSGLRSNAFLFLACLVSSSIVFGLL